MAAPAQIGLFAPAAPVRMKRCPTCERDLPFESFDRSRGRKHGRAGWCKRCRTAYLSGGRKRGYRIKGKYGLTNADYDAMLAQQLGVCAACGQPPTERCVGRRLVIDHDHATGKVRGLLCNLCNRALGLLRDDLDRVAGLHRYIERHRA